MGQPLYPGSEEIQKEVYEDKGNNGSHGHNDVEYSPTQKLDVRKREIFSSSSSGLN